MGESTIMKSESYAGKKTSKVFQKENSIRLDFKKKNKHCSELVLKGPINFVDMGLIGRQLGAVKFVNKRSFKTLEIRSFGGKLLFTSDFMEFEEKRVP